MGPRGRGRSRGGRGGRGARGGSSSRGRGDSRGRGGSRGSGGNSTRGGFKRRGQSNHQNFNPKRQKFDITHNSGDIGNDKRGRNRKKSHFHKEREIRDEAPEIRQEEVESEEEEEEDAMKQLLGTFHSETKAKGAIDSSDESEREDGDVDEESSGVDGKEGSDVDGKAGSDIDDKDDSDVDDEIDSDLDDEDISDVNDKADSDVDDEDDSAVDDEDDSAVDDEDISNVYSKANSNVNNENVSDVYDKAHSNVDDENDSAADDKAGSDIVSEDDSNVDDKADSDIVDEDDSDLDDKAGSDIHDTLKTSKINTKRKKIKEKNEESEHAVMQTSESVTNKKIKPKKDVEDEIELDKEAEDDTSTEDPFIKHTQYEINDSLLTSVQNTPMDTNTTNDSWPILGNLTIQIPKCTESPATPNVGFTISEEKHYAPAGLPPQRKHTTLENLFIKKQIVGNIIKANKHSTDKIPLTPLQSELFSIMNNYQDLYYPQRTFENGEEIRFAYCLHAVNHILKTRMKIIHHNSRLSKKDDVPEEFRDQGLTRPKILIIAPFRDSAYRIIKMLIDILLQDDKGNVINKNRYIQEFTGQELIMPKKNPKPEDYELLFSGNSNDDFKIGMTVTKKSLKLYADFYSSDIIIASPLGLRYIIGAEGESERDFDFLASIELLILDQTEIFLMQNWDHLLHVFNHLHLQPKESHGTDFSRVRTWSLNGWAKFYRQTLIFSSVALPEINSIFNKKCFNYAGRVKVVNPVRVGAISSVYLQLPHVCHKFEAHDVAHGIEARFNFFISKILPQHKDQMMRQTLIYVANYFDYVRLRNYFKKEDIGFVQICEYSKDNKVARARDMFFHGDAHFLLYTERYHFFNRKRIKGIRHLVFYQPPNFSHFYHEMCNLMQEANMNKKVGSMTNMTVTVLYSKYDVQQLSGIVGTERAVKMVSSDRNVQLLLTD